MNSFIITVYNSFIAGKHKMLHAVVTGSEQPVKQFVFKAFLWRGYVM
jgi:hypothetical protein